MNWESSELMFTIFKPLSNYGEQQNKFSNFIILKNSNEILILKYRKTKLKIIKN